MGERGTGMGRSTFVAWATGIVALGALQSAAHLFVVLRDDRVGSIFDLDRSNSLPDVASAVALAAATSAAVALANQTRGGRRFVAWLLPTTLGLLTVADVAHAGPHPASAVGWVVIAMVVGTGVLLLWTSAGSGTRMTLTLAAAGCLLVGSFFVNALDQLDAARFERERGDPIAEYQIVIKEGLELVGWSLVALALWDEIIRRRDRARSTATTRASRAPAASTPRGA